MDHTGSLSLIKIGEILTQNKHPKTQIIPHRSLHDDFGHLFPTRGTEQLSHCAIYSHANSTDRSFVRFREVVTVTSLFALRLGRLGSRMMDGSWFVTVRGSFLFPSGHSALPNLPRSPTGNRVWIFYSAESGMLKKCYKPGQSWGDPARFPDFVTLAQGPGRPPPALLFAAGAVRWRRPFVKCLGQPWSTMVNRQPETVEKDVTSQDIADNWSFQKMKLIQLPFFSR